MQHIYLLAGPPGSGKGTQADLARKEIRVPLLQVGNLLRLEELRGSKIGKMVSPYLRKGLLAPYQVVNELVLARLTKLRRKQVIVDGFPRQVAQARQLARFIHEKKVACTVIELQLSNKIIFERIRGRRSCSCGATYHIQFQPPKVKDVCDRCGKKLFIRNDSELAVVKRRLKVYRDQTVPALRFMMKVSGCHYVTIDATKSIPDVFAAIKKLFYECY